MNILKIALTKTLCLAACIIALAAPGTTFACSCMVIPEALQIEKSDFVFSGYLNANPKENADGSAVYTFDRLDILKGSSRPTVEISVSSMDGNICGYKFLPDVKYRVYASERDGILKSGLCSVQVIPVSEKVIPIEDIMTAKRVEKRLQTSKEIKSATDNLLQAGCSLQLQTSGVPGCIRQTDASPLICKGQFTSVFKAVDGSYDLQDHLYEWNRNTDELRVTGVQGFLILPEECANGMDGELRWKTNRGIEIEQ